MNNKISINATILFPGSTWKQDELQSLPAMSSLEPRTREEEPRRQCIPRQEPGNKRISFFAVGNSGEFHYGKLFSAARAVLVSCLLCWSLTLSAEQPQMPSDASSMWQFQMHPDRLQIVLKGETVAQFIFQDQNIRRPYFANLKLPGGVQVTRNHPPIEGVDATDHDTMHPGLWLGFGDISGVDFWRNKGSMEHLRFVDEPKIQNGRLLFATECRFVNEQGEPMGLLLNHFVLMTCEPEKRDGESKTEKDLENSRDDVPSWLLVWKATISASQRSITIGDQEEMGFGARVATAITEKQGGRIVSSAGQQSAMKTWGQPADWCDYSGTIDGQAVGITLMADRKNFRQSWWHNRDYGVFVANPFGRQAMKQGEKSDVSIEKGRSLTLRFGALIHTGAKVDLGDQFNVFMDAGSH